jgi:hypothetical protein
MRLVTGVKYLSGKRLNSTTVYLLLFCIYPIFFIPSVCGQTYRLSFEQIPLSQALVRVSEKFNIKVAFDSEKL